MMTLACKPASRAAALRRPQPGACSTATLSIHQLHRTIKASASPASWPSTTPIPIAMSVEEPHFMPTWREHRNETANPCGSLWAFGKLWIGWADAWSVRSAWPAECFLFPTFPLPKAGPTTEQRAAQISVSFTLG